MENLSLEQVKWDQVSDGKLGIAQSVVNHADSGAIKFLKFEPGAVYPLHHHMDKYEWVYVLEGNLDAEVDGQKGTIGSGEFRSFPAMSKHSLVAGEDGATVIVCYLVQPKEKPL